MKKYITILLAALFILIPINVFGENNRIVDNAYKLSENQKSELIVSLDALSLKYDMDIVVYLSVDDSYGDDIVSEGCEFYDGNGYGYGDDHRGVLLIINYNQGMFDIITTGNEVREKYDGYIEDCYDAIQNSLSNNPYEAIEIFEYWVDTRFYNETSNIDENVVEENVVVEKNNTVRDLTVSTIVSIIISAATGLLLKSQLKTEGKKRGASNYMDKNSFNLTRSGDIFLYRTTTRRRIKSRSNDNNFHNSGGNGFHISHTSSHGISHGSGGGRHF